MSQRIPIGWNIYAQIKQRILRKWCINYFSFISRFISKNYILLDLRIVTRTQYIYLLKLHFVFYLKIINIILPIIIIKLKNIIIPYLFSSFMINVKNILIIYNDAIPKEIMKWFAKMKRLYELIKIYPYILRRPKTLASK